MKKILIFVCAFMFVATVALAAGPKTYQVTGPVLAVTADTIVVEKGKDKWEVGRDAATKRTGCFYLPDGNNRFFPCFVDQE